MGAINHFIRDNSKEKNNFSQRRRSLPNFSSLNFETPKLNSSVSTSSLLDLTSDRTSELYEMFIHFTLNSGQQQKQEQVTTSKTVENIPQTQKQQPSPQCSLQPSLSLNDISLSSEEEKNDYLDFVSNLFGETSEKECFVPEQHKEEKGLIDFSFSSQSSINSKNETPSVHVDCSSANNLDFEAPPFFSNGWNIPTVSQSPSTNPPNNPLYNYHFDSPSYPNLNPHFPAVHFPFHPPYAIEFLPNTVPRQFHSGPLFLTPHPNQTQSPFYSETTSSFPQQTYKNFSPFTQSTPTFDNSNIQSQPNNQFSPSLDWPNLSQGKISSPPNYSNNNNNLNKRDFSSFENAQSPSKKRKFSEH